MILRSIRQLGLKPALLFAWYRFKMGFGLIRRQTPLDARASGAGSSPRSLFKAPTSEELRRVLGDQSQALIDEANEILNGQVRLFGKPPEPLSFDDHSGSEHWSRYAGQLPDGGDIKLVWEAGRLGWATSLARAYALVADVRFAQGFWDHTERFLAANPPNRGPHWSSAQEVALRLISLAFCYSVLAQSPASTPLRKAQLAASLAVHAERITPTLAYARAQNNNHLLSEALGLYTAAALLPEHPQARKWRRLGRKYYVQGIRTQIDTDGTYSQHSSNYHRLMLQLALWGQLVASSLGEGWPADIEEKLAAATNWLLAMLDENSGSVPNLGPNDGAYILPLSVLPFGDYRPILQAAGATFLGAAPLGSGAWDEMALWLAPGLGRQIDPQPHRIRPLHLVGHNSWAYLRAAHFTSRPGHADQLHLDLWWRGHNLARDAGTYRYNAAAPWDNALAATRVHNTITVNGQDQMTRAGRFLWLDWAQARVLEQEEEGGKLISATAEHDGYRQIGILHRRKVTATGSLWLIEDELLPTNPQPRELSARLHWLLPDWDYLLEGSELRLQSPHGQIHLIIEADKAAVWLVRAGELVAGDGEADPILGWFSPSYDLKLPALSLIAEANTVLPIRFRSTWTLPQ